VAAEQEAEHSSEQYRRVLYTSDMNLAALAAKEASLGELRRLLKRHVPEPGQTDLRGFEWYYFWRVAHPPAKRISFPDDLTLIEASPDGQVLAAASGMTMSFVEVSSFKVFARLEGHTAEVKLLEFLPDGKQLLSASVNEFCLWDFKAETKKPGVEFSAQLVGVIGKDYFRGPDESRRASGSLSDGKNGSSDTTQWRQERVVAGIKEYLTTVYPERENSGFTDLTDIARLVWGSAGNPLKAQVFQIGNSLLLPDGKTMLTVGFDGRMVLTDQQSGHRTEHSAHSSTIMTVIGSAYGLFATVSEDRTVGVWDAHTHKKRRTIVAHDGDVISVAFLGEGSLLATEGRVDRTLCLSNILAAPDALTVAPVGETPLLALSPDRHLLATGAHSAFTEHSAYSKIWDLKTGRLLYSIQTGAPRIALSPDGRWLISAGRGSQLRLIDVRTLAGIRLFRSVMKERLFSCVAFSPDSRNLAIASVAQLDGRPEIEVWDVAAARLVHEFPIEHAVQSIAYSPDGQVLVTAGGQSAPTTWDATTGERLATWPESRYPVAFSPDGEVLALPQMDGTVKLLEVSTQEIIRTLRGHGGPIRALAWWPDGKTLATGSNDNTVRIWRVATGEELTTLRFHNHIVVGLALSRDGSTLVSSSIDGSVRIYRAAGKEEVRKGASRWVPPPPAHVARAYKAHDAARRLMAEADDQTKSDSFPMWETYEVALAILQQLAQEFPDKPEYRWELARARDKLASHLATRSISKFSLPRAKKLVKENAWAKRWMENETLWRALGETEFRLREWGDAAVAHRAVELTHGAVDDLPENGEVWYTLGVAQNAFGAWDEAVASFSKAADLGVRATALPTANVRRRAGPITIDGKLDEAAWQNAARIELSVNRFGKTIGWSSTVRTCWNDEALYLAADSPIPDGVALYVPERGRDNNNLWEFDGIEIFLSSRSVTHYAHFMISAAGDVFDGLVDFEADESTGDPGWNTDVQVATSNTANEYVLEVRIPFKDLAASPKSGDRWGANFCRYRPAQQIWSPTYGGHHTPTRFGTLEFVGLPGENGGRSPP
jgi:WD40 repeat protein